MILGTAQKASEWGTSIYICVCVHIAGYPTPRDGIMYACLNELELCIELKWNDSEYCTKTKADIAY